MRPLARRRRRAKKQTKDTPEPLARLRRRCIIGLCLAVAAFIAAFVTDLSRRAPSNDPNVLGVEILAASVGAACGGSAVLTRIIGHVSDTNQSARADDLRWAFHLGANLADAYRAPVPDNETPRGPNAR